MVLRGSAKWQITFRQQSSLVTKINSNTSSAKWITDIQSIFRRHDSALNDGSDNNVNLVGGYYDAG